MNAEQCRSDLTEHLCYLDADTTRNGLPVCVECADEIDRFDAALATGWTMPDGWTQADIIRHRMDNDIPERMYPIASADGVVGWGVPMTISIPTFKWKQIGSDMNPGTHGAIIAQADGITIDLREIQPVVAFVGEGEGAEVGFPFWTREASFWIDDLDQDDDTVKSALICSGLTEEAAGDRLASAVVIAKCLLAYGHAEEGPAGWARDVVPDRVLWWGHPNRCGWRYLADEDSEYRRILREQSR